MQAIESRWDQVAELGSFGGKCRLRRKGPGGPWQGWVCWRRELQRVLGLALWGCAGGRRSGAIGWPSLGIPRARLRRTLLLACGRPPPWRRSHSSRGPIQSAPGGSASQRMSKWGAGTPPCLPHSAARPCGRLVHRRRQRRRSRESVARHWSATREEAAGWEGWEARTAMAARRR